MRFQDGHLSTSATDLTNFLACRHRTALELGETRGKWTRPQWHDPLLDVLRQRGLEHERGYVAALTAVHDTVIDLASLTDHEEVVGGTLDAMRAGARVIIQAGLAHQRWYGRPDVLLRVDANDMRSQFGAWSYEVADTKLARETRGGTILQLGLYCRLLESAQGVPPAQFHVITPDAAGRRVRTYRVDDYAAYFRLVKTRLEQAIERDDERLAAANYPEPIEHCDVCPWSPVCQAKRRRDDHLSLVAGISRLQRRELGQHAISTLTELGRHELASDFKPARGARKTYVRVQRQARVQLESAGRQPPICESLLPDTPGAREDAGQPYVYPADVGLSRLPAPSAGDLFLDLEGDPFAAEGGREYLFGLVDASGSYGACWAFTPADERSAFESVVDRVMQTWVTCPDMHVYHYAPYEPAAFKRLAGRYATRAQDIDRLLRAGVFVDLYAVVRQGLVAGIERYSIKNLEVFYGLTRSVSLLDANRGLRAVEQAIEWGRADDIPQEARDVVLGYNRDDCLSTLRLRDWLETRRTELESQGTPIPRPAIKEGEPSKELDDREKAVEKLRAELTAGIPDKDAERSTEQRARRTLAYLLDWHRRESKAEWWEYYRLRELPEYDLMEEPRAVAGLEFVREIEKVKRSFVHRYRYPTQEIEIRTGDELKTQDGKKFGEVSAIDRTGRTIDLLVGPSKADQRPTALFAHTYIDSGVIEDAIFAVGQSWVDGRVDPVASAQLRRTPPRLWGAAFSRPPIASGGVTEDYAVDIVTRLDATVLPIQGPPGSGKTFTGARMICALLDVGKKVGITANSHAVIRNLFEAVQKQAGGTGTVLRMIHKRREDEDDENVAEPAAVEQVGSNGEVAERLRSGAANLAGGTAWLWADAELATSVDVLFVDEAGQMSLANTLAVTRAAGSLVLLGDPQQLDQPQKGSHPEGAGVSALQHVLDEHRTMPAERGLFLPVTWRLAPAICEFTSKAFYEGKLTAKPGLENQKVLINFEPQTSNLIVMEVEHDDNRNSSMEEVEQVAAIVGRLVAAGSRWSDESGSERQITLNDVLIISPYNAQVARLQEALPPRARIGTVDKFQGQEAAVVIYSMATSRPEDAPRGMEFLYSLNRLNVATSRARCACILVASPRLFEPDCRTPRQMQLANALCRYREMAVPLWRSR